MTAARGGGRAGPALLAATAVAAIAFHWLRLWLAPSAPADPRPLLPAAAPAAHDFSGRHGDPPRWTAQAPGPGGATVAIGSVVSSADLAPGVRGYAGAVPLLVGVAPDGSIMGVALLPNHETPAYAARVGEGDFLRQFTGKKAADPLALGEDVDGVTRATVTAAAVADGVRLAARAAARGIYGQPIPPDAPAPAPLPWLALAAVAGTIALGLASLLLSSAALRWASLAVSLAVLGFWQSTWLSASHFAGALLWRWPSPAARPAWYLLFAVALGAAALWRNLYCARLCPFGALQQLLHALSPWRLAAAADEERRAQRLRTAYLWIATIAVFGFGVAEAADFEPFGTAFDFREGAPRRLLLGAVLLLAVVRHRPWCRYFCPTGTCLTLLGRRKAPDLRE